MNKKFNPKYVLTVTLAALMTSGLLTLLLNVGKALASVSWNG